MDSPFHNPWYFREYVFFQKQSALQMSQMNLYKAETIAKNVTSEQSPDKEFLLNVNEMLFQMMADQINYTDTNIHSHILYHGIPLEKTSCFGTISPHEEISLGLDILGQTFPFYMSVIAGDNKKIAIQGPEKMSLVILMLSYLSFQYWRSVIAESPAGIMRKFLNYLKYRDDSLILSEEEKEWSFFTISVQTSYSDSHLYLEYSDLLGTSMKQFDDMHGESKRKFFDWFIQQMDATVSDLESEESGICIGIPLH